MDYNTHDLGKIRKRDFVRLDVAGTTGSALGGFDSIKLEVLGAESPLPKRLYGKTDLQLSALVGASDWIPDVIPMAVAAGVNYWHKSQHWNAQTFPEANKSQPPRVLLPGSRSRASGR